MNAKSQNLITKQGTVAESLPNSTFRVMITDPDTGEEYTVLASLAGKIRRFYNRILPGDRVTIEFYPYDLEHGRIVAYSKTK